MLIKYPIILVPKTDPTRPIINVKHTAIALKGYFDYMHI